MIIEWLVTGALQVTAWVVGLFEPLGLPPDLVNVDQTITSFIEEHGEGMGVWVEWNLVGTLMGIGLAVWAVSLGVKVVRVLIAHIPLFGGKG